MNKEGGLLSLRQWVSRVRGFSSAYDRGWEATCIIGPPSVYPRHGDIWGAWAPLRSTGTHEWIEIEFSRPVYPTGILIFETFNPGAIVRIQGTDQTDSWQTLWEEQLAERPYPEVPGRVFEPSLKRSFAQKIHRIRLDLDCTYAPSWSEIDAVELRGIMSLHWTPELYPGMPENFKQLVKTMILAAKQKESLTPEVLKMIFTHAAIHWFDGFEAGERISLSNDTDTEEDVDMCLVL